MGQILFWIEAVAASVLFIALGLTLLPRIRSRWTRAVLLALWLLLSTVPWLAVMAGFLVVNVHVRDTVAPTSHLPEAFVAAALAIALGAFMAILIRRIWLRAIFIAVAVVLGGVLFALLATGIFNISISFGGILEPLICSYVAVTAFIVASVVLIRRSRRPLPITGQKAAVAWPLGRIAVAFVAAFIVACMTFWNLDLAVRQQMAAMQVEAGSIALSVSPPRIPDSQNAAVLYRQAWESLGVSDQRWDDQVRQWHHEGEGHFDPNDPQMLEFLHKHTGVIEMLHHAAELPASNFGFTYAPLPIEVNYARVASETISLGRLLCVSFRASVEHGDSSHAANDVNAILAMAEHCANEPVLLETLVAISDEYWAFDSFQYLLDHGAAGQKAVLAVSPSPLMSFNASLHNAMRMETASGISTFGMLDPSSASRASSLRGTAMDRPVIDAAALYRVFAWDKDVQSYTRHMRTYEDLSTKPYYQVAQQWTAADKSAAGIDGLLARFLTPELAHAAEQAAFADAQHQLMILAVALEKYRQVNGRFPDALAALTPDYLPALPVDPFTGQSLKMIHREGWLVIYSVGRDLTDDAGEPIRDAGNPGRAVLRKGDIILSLPME